MTLPRKIKFTARTADHETGHWFECVRKGHPPGKKRIRRRFQTRRERETYIRRHDAKYHDELLANELGIAFGPLLGETVADFMQHFHDLVRDGKRDHKTLAYYRVICKHLVEHFGYDARLDQIGRRAALDYARKVREAGSSSRGARIVKELKVIRRLQAFADIPVGWKIPTDDIGPEKRERVSIPLEDIRDFIAAMPADSLERDFVLTKFLTMLRNEELYAADVGDVDLDARAFGLWLRNKQTGQKERHHVHIPDSLVPVLKRRIGERRFGPLFALDGKRLTYTTLRKRFLSASKEATSRRRKDDPKARAVSITAVGQLRHEAATLADEALKRGREVSTQMGHKSEKTMPKHYKLRKKSAALAASKKVTKALEKKLSVN